MEETKGISRTEIQAVTVKLGAEVFGLPIETVEAIVAWEPLTRLPRMPAFVSGVLSVRGSVLPIMDLRVRFGLEPTAPTHAHRILILLVEGVRFGAIVDAVCSVERLAESHIERNVPLVVSLSDEFIGGVVNRESGMIILVKPEGLLTESERKRLDKVAQQAAQIKEATKPLSAAA